MKAKNFYLISDMVQANAVKAIQDTVLDGKTKVTISSAGTKSQRQRGLQHIWYNDVVKSGVGGMLEESHNGVDSFAKRNFAMPIIKRDYEKYAGFMRIYDALAIDNTAAHQAGFVNYFFHEHLHTEWFDTQEMAEFLTAFQNYYISHGVNLSDPMDHKLLQAHNRLTK